MHDLARTKYTYYFSNTDIVIAARYKYVSFEG